LAKDIQNRARIYRLNSHFGGEPGRILRITQLGRRREGVFS